MFAWCPRKYKYAPERINADNSGFEVNKEIKNIDVDTNWNKDGLRKLDIHVENSAESLMSRKNESNRR